MKRGKQQSARNRPKVWTGQVMMHSMARLDETGLTPIIRLTCANVKHVGRGSAARIVVGETARIKLGSTCFSLTFAARLRRRFLNQIYLDKVMGYCHRSGQDDTY